MKRLVKTSVVLLSLCLIALLFTGCGSKEKDRVLYKTAELSKLVELGEYTDIPVDMKSDEILGLIDDLATADISNNQLYNEIKSGKIQNGDIANIDYEGKKDGVAFEGGTDEGYDLEIGSNSFITGFEEGLIGVAVGKTVDLDLTFPEDYGSEELAGEDVVFTVKVNSVKRLKTPVEAYSELGFKNYAAYEKDLQERAAKQYLMDAVCANSKSRNIRKKIWI